LFEVLYEAYVTIVRKVWAAWPLSAPPWSPRSFGGLLLRSASSPRGGSAHHEPSGAVQQTVFDHIRDHYPRSLR